MTRYPPCGCVIVYWHLPCCTMAHAKDARRLTAGEREIVNAAARAITEADNAEEALNLGIASGVKGSARTRLQHHWMIAWEAREESYAALRGIGARHA